MMDLDQDCALHIKQDVECKKKSAPRLVQSSTNQIRFAFGVRSQSYVRETMMGMQCIVVCDTRPYRTIRIPESRLGSYGKSKYK